VRVLGVVLLALFAVPLGWALAASFTPEARLFDGALLGPAVLDHYRALLHERELWGPLWSSIVVAGATTLVCVSLGTLAGYALARLRFPGRGAVLGLVLAAGMFPSIAIVSPLYTFLRALGLIDTYAGLILPYTSFGLPLAIWLLTTFFRHVPREVEEAAHVDGAGRLRTLVEIFLPLALPGIATTAVVVFITCWNELLFALAFTVSPERRTVPVAIALFRGQYQVPWGEVMAAMIVATLPAAALVIVFQKRLVRGLTAGALKG
jgi:trehalose/maltose transport system permease protein